MKMKKIIGCTVALVCSLAALGAAGCTEQNDDNPTDGAIEYTKYASNTIGFNDNSDSSLSNYNTNLYYLNQWENYSSGIGFPDMGDPMIVYYDGYYYAYGTRGTTSVHCFRSENLSNWTQLSDCFVPESESWGKTSIWAPDIQKIGDKWYLYYTAAYNYGTNDSSCQIGVAVADYPYGPFKQFVGTNKNGETITLKDTSFLGLEHHTILDSTVFQDDDGELYMYFSYDAKTGSEETRARAKDTASAEIWGVKLKDPVTWDLTTLTPLISPGYQTLSDSYRKIAWETWSPSFDAILGVECCEGPYMIKSNGKYYLTYCANSYVDVNYAVGYAVSDSPLGDYYKPNDTYLENMILGVPAEPGTYTYNRYIGFTTGTGHASVFKTAGGELMFAYHAHWNRDEWDNSGYNRGNYRALAIDYIYFDGNGVPYTNGPTYSLQNAPSDISGYKNIASQATFRIEGENAEYLYDNFTNRAYETAEVAKEATFNAGTRSIELTFDSPVTIRAINIYNSYNKDLSVDKINQIDFGENRGIVNAMFNQRYYSTKYQDFIYPHTAFNIELDSELVTSRVVITISSDFNFALGEIEIIGK